MRKWTGLVACASGLVGCVHGVDVAVERVALMSVDERFANETAARGAIGWASFFAEDGRMMTNNGPIIVGREQIQKAMAQSFARPGFALQWQPTSADVSRSGDLGYTTGGFQVMRNGSDGKPTVATRGKYVTVWKKQSDGSWKVVVDIGNPDP